MSYNGIPFTMVSVKEFGAKGDGVTDDTTAIQRAVTALAGTGMWVYFPQGTYETTAPIVLASRSLIWGSPSARIEGTIPGASTNDAVFLAVPSGVVATPTLAAPAAAGATSVTLSSAAGVAIGDFLQIYFSANAFNQQIFQITNLAGAVATLDRPTVRDYPNASGVNVYTSVPEQINIQGNGMSVSGECVIYVTLVSARDCEIDGINCDPFASSGGASDAGIALNTGCFRCNISDCVVNASSGTAGNKSFAVIAGDTCSIRRSEAFSALTVAFGITDCVYCNFEDLTAYSSANGMSLASEGGALGDRSVIYCFFKNLNLYGNTTDGLTIQDGASFNSFDGVVADLNATGITLVNSALQMTGNKFANVSAQRNSLYGIQIGAGVKRSVFANVDVSNNTTTGFLASDEVVISNLVAESLTSAGFVLNAASASGSVIVNGITVRGFSSPQYAVQVNAGLCQISGADIQLSASSIGIGIINGVCVIEQTKIEPIGAAGGTEGIVVNGGAATARIGVGVNVKACATPLSVLSGYVNRGTLVLNSASPPSIAFPDLTAQDNVKLTLTLLGGAGTGLFPAVVSTPGTGFIATGPAGDTSTWAYEIS